MCYAVFILRACSVNAALVAADSVSFDAAVARHHFAVVDGGVVALLSGRRLAGRRRLRLGPGVLGRGRVRVGAVPDVGQTEAGVEAIEEQQRQVDVGHQQPRQLRVVVDHRIDCDAFDERRATDPDGDVGDDEERDDSAARHLFQVNTRQRVATQTTHRQQHLPYHYKRLSLCWPPLAVSVMHRPGVRPSVFLIFLLALIGRAAQTQRDSPGGSMGRGRPTFRSDSKQDRHTLAHAQSGIYQSLDSVQINITTCL